MSRGFTSGTISGTFKSYLKSEELSITVQSFFAALVAYCFVASEPIVNNATSQFLKSKVS